MWVVLFLLGCYHGVNPAMGWLFAVALGLQERSTRAVAAAIVPIAIGHVASVAVIVFVALSAARTLPHPAVRLAASLLLIGFGVYRLARTRHPRWVGMRVGFGGLIVWGFLMASAHGAGLMLLPFVVPASPMAMDASMSMSMPMAMPPASASLGMGVSIVAVHSLGYLLVTTVVALVVYRWFGLKLLRTAWFNVDLVWSVALIAAGLFALAT
ncbi:MAG: hypothetical protein JWN27_523 [Candidatus Eremiobacteraeota bacterium]|nr:hypothetical protein [Candidatus Eremiobacteraeota bacterium]